MLDGASEVAKEWRGGSGKGESGMGERGCLGGRWVWIEQKIWPRCLKILNSLDVISLTHAAFAI